jgi:hypothetical protein
LNWPLILLADPTETVPVPLTDSRSGFSWFWARFSSLAEIDQVEPTGNRATVALQLLAVGRTELDLTMVTKRNPMRRLALDETTDDATTREPAVDSLWALVEDFTLRAVRDRARATKTSEQAGMWMGSAKAWDEAADHLQKVADRGG